jgi:hypothetical protein
MPALRRQYSIDNYLGRYGKALRHLCELNALDEVKSYTVIHELYSEALEFYRYQEERLMEIMHLYADYLQTNGNFKDAGIGPLKPYFASRASAKLSQPTNTSTTTLRPANRSVKPIFGEIPSPAPL